MDGTLIEAWASMKSFRPKDGSGEPPAPGRNGERDFHGERRSNETHASAADPDARLFKKAAGQASRLCHMGHVLMENRNALVVDATTTTTTGTAEREAAVAMAGDLLAGGRITLGGDKAYDSQEFVAEMRRLGVTRRTSRRTPRDAAPPLMAAPPAIPAMRSACVSASGSRKSSAGSRRLAVCARPAIVAPVGSAGCSPSQRPPTTWCGFRSCWLARRSHARTLSTVMIFARPSAENRQNWPIKPASESSIPIRIPQLPHFSAAC